MKKLCLILTLALGFAGAAFSQGVNWNDYTPVWKQDAYLQPGGSEGITTIKDGFSASDALAYNYGDNATVKLYGNAVETSAVSWGAGTLKGYSLPEGFYFGNTQRTHFIVSGSLAVYMASVEDVPYQIFRSGYDKYHFTNLGSNTALASFLFFDNKEGKDAQITATENTSIRFWTSGDSCLVVEWKDINLANSSEAVSAVVSLQIQLFNDGDIAYAISTQSTPSSDDICATVFLRDHSIDNGYGYYVNSGAGNSNWSSDLTLPVSLSKLNMISQKNSAYSFGLNASLENNLALRLTTEEIDLPSCEAPAGITFETDLLNPDFYPTEDDFYSVVGKYTHLATTNSYYQGFKVSGTFDSILFVVVPAENKEDFNFTPTTGTSYVPGETVATYGIVGSYSSEYWGQFRYVTVNGLEAQTAYVIYAYPFNNNADVCVDGPAYAAVQEVASFSTLPDAPVVTGVVATETGAKIGFDGFEGEVFVTYAEHALTQGGFGQPDASVNYEVGGAFGGYATVVYVDSVKNDSVEFSFTKKENTTYSFRVWAYVESGDDVYFSSESSSASLYNPASSIPTDFRPQPTEGANYIYDYSMPLQGWGECEGFRIQNASYCGSLFNGQESKVFYGNVNADTAMLTTPWFSAGVADFEVAINFGIFNNRGAAIDLAEGDSVKVFYASKPESDGDTVWTLLETVTSLSALSTSSFNTSVKELFCHFTGQETNEEIALRIEFIGNKAEAESSSFAVVVSSIRVQEATLCFAPEAIVTVDGSVTNASAQLKWNAAKDNEGQNAVGYSVLYQMSGSSAWDTIKNVEDTTVVFSGLKPRSTYTVKVSAVCAEGKGVSEERSSSFATIGGIPDSMIIPEISDWTKFDYKQYNYVGGQFVPQANRWQLVYNSSYTGSSTMYASVKVGDSTSILSMHPIYKDESSLVKVDVKVAVDNGGNTLASGDIKNLFTREFRFKVVASKKGDFSDYIEIGEITRNDLALHSFKTFSFYADKLKDSLGTYTIGMMYSQAGPATTLKDPGAEFFFESAIVNYLDCEAIAQDTVTEITHNTAKLSWSSELEYFSVVYGTETKMDTVKVEGKQTLSLSQLLPETPYTYSIIGYFDDAFNFVCENSHVEGNFTTKAEPAPVPVCGVPTALESVVDTVEAKAALSWKAGENNVSYELIWKASSASAFDTVEVKDSVYTLDKLEFNTAYVWSVRGVCEEGLVSDFAEEVEFTTVEKTVSVENTVAAAIRVVAQEGMIHILNAGMLNIDRVDVFTTTGSMVTSQRVGASANVSIPVVGGRVLMVAVYSAGERAVYKVFVR